MVYELQNPIPMYCRSHGLGSAFMMIDYGLNINTVWVVRLKGGRVKHFLSEDIVILGNPMLGESDDIPKDW